MRKLGFTGALSLVIGNIIGVGIFTTTGYITLYLQEPIYIMLAWVLGAVYALSGAQVYSILSRKYPLSGGDYQYLRRSLHPIFGYLFGWAAFFVTYSGSIAALGIAAASYLHGIVDMPGFETTYILFSPGGYDISFSQSKVIAIIFILIFTWISYRGIILSGKYQIALTGMILIFLVFFSVSGLLSPNADYSLLTLPGKGIDISGFLTSLIAVLFAYIGWTTAVYVAEEIEQPMTNIPLALKLGVLIVGIIYVAVNLVYLLALPTEQMKDVINIASIAFERLWGKSSGVIISVIILTAVLSSLNSTILSGPRIYMAMGREGYLMGTTAKLHSKYGSPYIAILLQAIWSILLVLSGSFNQLLSFVVFIIVAFSFLAASISLRIIIKEKRQSFTNLAAIGFYTVLCLTIMINTLIEKPVESIIGCLLILLALPFYQLEKKHKEKYRT